MAYVVNPSFINSKAPAMPIYKYFRGGRLPRDSNKAKDNAIRMAEMVLSTRNFEIIQDLRELNVRLESSLFAMFWSEPNTFLESHVHADDRRHDLCTLQLHVQHIFEINERLECR